MGRYGYENDAEEPLSVMLVSISSRSLYMIHQASIIATSLPHDAAWKVCNCSLISDHPFTYTISRAGSENIGESIKQSYSVVMAPANGLRELVSQLEQVYSSNSSTSSSKPLLTQAKVQLAQAGLLLPSKPSPQGASSSDLEAAREILSYGALLSLRERDFDAFQRYILQVKPFWDPALG